MGLDMVNREIGPRQRLPALGATLLIVGVPQKPALFDGERSLVIFLLKQATKYSPEYLGPALSGGKTICVPLNSKQVVGK
jgi:hypothetical protein